MSDSLVIAGRAFASRLIVGTGKYRSFGEMQRAHEASGADMVTVAVRRVNLTDRTKESLLDYVNRDKYFLLPNTAGCYTADEAVRTARLGREVGLSNWVKLEVIGDQQTFSRIRRSCSRNGDIGEGRVCGAAVYQRRSRGGAEAGRCWGRSCDAVGRADWVRMGIQNHVALRILRERITEVPLIVDAGVGTASDAAVAMEMGADGVLMNTAIAEAEDAVLMASAMRHAVLGGREAFLAGRMAKKLYAAASSPVAGVVR